MAAKKKAVAKKPAAELDGAAISSSGDDGADLALYTLTAIRRKREREDAAMFVGSDEMALKVRGAVSSQAPTVDKALGRGGYPMGRLTIVSGKEGSGKTTLLLHAIAECQCHGGMGIIFDKEYTLDPDYAKAIGVDTSRLIISQDGTLEDTIEDMHTVIDSVDAFRRKVGRRVPVIVGLDSINAALASARIKGDVGDAHVAPEARLWSAELPRLLSKAYHQDIALVFVSQVRSKINVMFGNPDDIAGGNAMKFYASIILGVTNIGASRENTVGDKVTSEDKEALKVGYMAVVEARKNKVAPPFRKATIQIRYGVGIVYEQSLILACSDQGILKKSGSWYEYDGERIGNGMDATIKVLKKNKDLTHELVGKFRESMGWADGILTSGIDDAAPLPPELGEGADPPPEHSEECLGAGTPECVGECPVAAWWERHPEAVMDGADA